MWEDAKDYLNWRWVEHFNGSTILLSVTVTCKPDDQNPPAAAGWGTQQLAEPPRGSALQDYALWV